MASPGRWLRTVRHMKVRQWAGRLRFALRRSGGLRARAVAPPGRLNLPPPPWTAEDFPRLPRLRLLNREAVFTDAVDWGYRDFGPLWHYTLNSFDWGLPPGGDAAPALDLMESFLAGLEGNPAGLDPWPTSRRIVNWIRLLDRPGTDPHRRARLAGAVEAQAAHLSHHLEYHLLGNHLLENGLALLWAGTWLGERRLLNRARRLLIRQLDRQVLADGGHEERSTMYHCRLLAGLLDALDMLRRNPGRGAAAELPGRLETAADAMLGWVRAMALGNGDIPCVNDSAPGGFPPLPFLENRAGALGLRGAPAQLGESGYRRLNAPGIEALMDVGPPGPRHNPGHGHCDALAVLLYAGGLPLLVDPGVTAYHDPAVRAAERGTAAHNTVQVNGYEQNEIWGAFRMGRRALVRDLERGDGFISAAHTGYGHLGVRHHRRLDVVAGEARIRDRIVAGKSRSCAAYFHFPPRMDLRVEADRCAWPGGEILWRGGRVARVSGWVSAGFNRRMTAPVIRVNFMANRVLETRIRVKA